MVKKKRMELLKKSYDNLPISILNTSKYYPQGRDILIHVLMRETDYKANYVINWLRDNNIEVYQLGEYHGKC